MKKTSFNPRMLLMSLALLGTVQLAGAAGQSIWSGLGADMNWSTAGNWTANGGSTPPAATDTAVFANNASAPTSVATVDTIVSVNTTVGSLLYTNINPATHNTQINPGVTLTVNGPLTVGLISQTTVDAMSGTGNLIVNSTGNFTVGGSAATSTMTLADGSNQIMCATLSIGESGSGNGRTDILNLGNGTNEFFANAMNLGTGKGSGTIQFAGANGGVLIAGANGAGRVPAVLMGSGTSGTGASKGQLLLAGHPANVIVSNVNMCVLGGDTGSGVSSTITLDNGAFDVTSLIMGKTTSSEAGNLTSTMTIGGSANTAMLIVNASTLGSTGNGSFIIADSTLGTGTANSTLTLNQNGVAQIYCPITKSKTANNNATINLNSGGVLIMESAADTIGTAAIPIDTVTLGGGTLQLSVAGATAEVEATTLNVNAPTTVNIGALPVIVHYPAQFPLLQYVTVNGDPTTITLGTLPAGTPPYQGYLSNNVGNLSVDLVVTNGFVPTGVDFWTGTTSSNWDLTTPNWSLFGGSTVFLNGAIVQFDDTAAGATNINLTAGVNPATMTVSNFVKSYNFSGPGALVGSASLTKSGTNTVVLANAGVNTFSGGLTINAGTVQFGNGGANGNLPNNAQAITDNANLVLNSSANTAVPGVISGTGNLTLNGAGVVSLSASNTYSGTTLVNAGSLMVDGYLAGGGLVTNAAGATLGGIGTNLFGQFNAGGIINPGDAGGIGTLTVSNLTLYASANPVFDLSASDSTMGNNVNDLLQVAGNLTVNNATLSIAVRGVPQPGATYAVMTYAGTLTGGFNSVVGGTHYAAAVDSTSTPNQVNVDITGSSGANLKWNSTTSSAWDTGASENWLNLGTSLADYFYAGDTVLMDDSVPNVATNLNIPAGVVIYPSIITNNSATSYVIGGAGSIGGAASVVKYGTGTLTISNANTFTGGLGIYGGTLKTGGGTALGSTTGQTVINPGATLDVFGQNLGAETVVASGTGVGGNGAIVNSGAQQTSALKNVTLADDTTFGGTNRWDIRGGSATLQTTGNPVNITKTSTNQVSLVPCTCNDGNLENVYIQQGVFAIQTSSTQFGDPSGFIFVSTNSFLEVWGLTAGLNKNIVLNDGGGFWSESGATAISGTIILTNNAAGTGPGTGLFTNDPASTLTLNATVTGPGNLLKNGAGATVLATDNNYTGNTTVGVGTLFVTDANGGAFGGTPSISVSAGAILDVSAVTPLVLNSAQTLSGSGTVNGDVTVPVGATIAPGTPAAIGTLTVTNSVTLGGTTVMKLSATSGGTNDVVSTGGALTLGGALNVTILAGPLPGNATFTLFSAVGGISGAFAATNLPALNPGQAWDTDNLANGVLQLVTTVNPNPTNITFTVSGNHLMLAWPADHTGWRLEAQTNSLATGLYTNWVPVPNSNLANGYTNTLDATKGAVFYRLVYP
jgi:fibronectin-binding autotransporter adhesin